MHMLIRHKVADFAKWKPIYDEHLPTREKAGLKEVHLLRNTENPNEVILLFSIEDLDKAKAFAASDDLRQAMQRAGVSDKPDVYFLEESPRTE
jgi:heme-degrading monooxygenase HmoA